MRLRARGIDVPLKKPVETASGTLKTAPVVLVDLTTDDGITGCAYVRTYTPTALPALTRLINDLEPLLGEDLSKHFKLLGTHGLVGIALAAIDMARHDAQAQERNLPLVTLLGGTPKPIPAYASLRSMSPRAAAQEAEEALGQGFTAVKIKVSPATDIDAIKAVRAVTDGPLMVDYNQSLSVEQALAKIPMLDKLGLHWIEEPTRAGDYTGHARIAQAATTPIQLGENLEGPHELEKSLGASDHVMLDAQKIGGVTGWREAAKLTDLPISSHAFPEISAHLLAITPSAHYLEYLDHVGPILAEPVQIKDGHALIRDRPGTGLIWDEDAVSACE